MQTTTTEQPDLLTISDVARMLDLSKRTVQRMADRKDIRTVRTPGGHRRFPLAEVQRVQQELGLGGDLA